MVRGILADANVRGQVDYLVTLMRSEPWTEFWEELGLVLVHFEEVGLLPTASDLGVWLRCQQEQLVLITDNRNYTGAESLEATIRAHNAPDSLPVFTIANLDRFNTDRAYVEQVLETLLDYLQRIDTVRGTGRLYLP